MDKQFDAGLMWFRGDLRVIDNAALAFALRACRRVYWVFLIDRDILDLLPRADGRVEFIRESLCDLDADLHQLSGDARTTRCQSFHLTRHAYWHCNPSARQDRKCYILNSCLRRPDGGYMRIYTSTSAAQ